MFPVRPAIQPPSLAGQHNGQLDASLLVPILPTGSAIYSAARAWEAMRAHAARDGVLLAAVSTPDTYRPLSVQEWAFFDRMTKVPQPGRPTRIYQGAVWWLKPGKAEVATPGTSKHGWAMAIDVGVIVDGRVVQITSDPDGPGPLRSGVEWLLKWAPVYGFSWEVQSEPWHLRYCLGDELPAGVQRTARATLRLGTRSPEVALLRRQLAGLGWYSGGTRSTIYGPRVARAVRRAQAELNVPVDGVWGPTTALAFDRLVDQLAAL